MILRINGVIHPLVTNPLEKMWQEFLSDLKQGIHDTILKPIHDVIEKGVDGYYDFISWLFTNVTKLITTYPIDLLNQPQVYRLQMVFAGYSILMIILMAMKEGFKAIFGASYTNIGTMIGRTVFALVGAGLTIPAIIFLVKCANLIVAAILALATGYLGGSYELGEVVKDFSAAGTYNFIASLLFMGAFLYYAFYALLKVGRRWFDLLMNMVASPFAWAAYVTDGTTKYFTTWLHSTGKMILANMVYAMYLVVIMTIVLAPGPVETFMGWLGRMFLILGGLYRLSHPPTWLSDMQPVNDGFGNITRKAAAPLQHMLSKLRR